MRLRSAVPCLGFVLLVTACGAGENPAVTADAAAPSAATPNLDAIAANVVRSMRVGEGDVVAITGTVRDLELLEDLVTETRKAGGSPALFLTTERIVRRSYDDVPEKYDALPPQWDRIMAEEADVVFVVDAGETPDLLAHVPPARVQARGRAAAPFQAQSFKRGVRVIEVGNGLYPTSARAERFGLTRDELARHFWDGLAADPEALRRTAEQLKPILTSGKQLRLTQPNGTDLTFQLDSRTYVNDGAISDADVKAGGADVLKYIPAGELYARVVQGSANGKVVADHYDFQGKDIPGLTIEVANGKITSITAPSGVEPLLAAYGNTKDGRENLSIVDIGLNPGIPAAPGSKVLTYVPAGMITVFFGSDVWAGGTNAAPFGITQFLSGATLAVDGKAIVENGIIKP